MLLQCPDCGTNYDVDDELVQDSSVQLQCESCEVELVAAAPRAPMVQDEKTAMLAALDPEELERILGKRGSAPAAAVAPKPPGGPGGGSIPPPTQRLEAYAPEGPVTAGPAAPRRASRSAVPVAPPGERPSAEGPALQKTTVGQASMGEGRGLPPTHVGPLPQAALAPARRARRRARSVDDDDPLAAIAGSRSGDSESAVARTPDPDPGEERKPTPVDPAPPAETTPDGPKRRGRQGSRHGAQAAEPEPASAQADPEGEEEAAPQRVLPVGLLVVGPLVLIGLLVGSVLLVLNFLSARDAPPPEPPKPLSYASALALVIRHNEGTYPSPTRAQAVEGALPVFVHSDRLLVRVDEVSPLDRGRVPRGDQQGLLLKSLAARLAMEIAPWIPPEPAEAPAEGAPAPPPSPAPMGRAAKRIVVTAEATVPFATIARVLYTAESVGYEEFVLAGQPADAPETLRGVKIGRLEWFRVAPGTGGRGLAVSSGPDDLVLFDRAGRALPGDEDGDGRLLVPRSSSAAGKLTSHLNEIQSGATRASSVTLQPDAGMPFDLVLLLLGKLGGEGDGGVNGLRTVILSGGDA